jgi:hypothetical protein
VEEKGEGGIKEERIAVKRALMSRNGYADAKVKVETATGVQQFEGVYQTLVPLPGTGCAAGLRRQMTFPVTVDHGIGLRRMRSMSWAGILFDRYTKSMFVDLSHSFLGECIFQCFRQGQSCETAYSNSVNSQF